MIAWHGWVDSDIARELEPREFKVWPGTCGKLQIHGATFDDELIIIRDGSRITWPNRCYPRWCYRG